MGNSANELIEQIGGRERLELLSETGFRPRHDDVKAMARALLTVMDAQGKAFGCDSCGGNGAVAIDHGEMGVEHMECPKCFKIPPSASVPECEWTYDEGDYFWSSSCGEDWQFTDGGPEENRVKFCQGCGGLVRIAAAPDRENKQ